MDSQALIAANMPEVKGSYLTCTASQALEYNAIHPHGFVSLNQLLESRAYTNPDTLIAGFPELLSQDDYWEVLSFTYLSLYKAANITAKYYTSRASLRPRMKNEKTDRILALLFPSCADLLVTLFAGIRLGYGVLLLAPQNTEEALAHLCKTVAVTHLIAHPSLLKLAQTALKDSETVTVVEMAPRLVWNVSTDDVRVEVALSPEEEQHLTALVMHTSGSTGMPKAIYQSHRVWTREIPCMPGEIAFTTTPLYHGGSCDFLRSMNALTPLFLFSSLYPVTTKNVLGSISVCAGVTAFLSVPYILKMLAEDAEGIRMLQSMTLVSTGGAPLPEALGDWMVSQGVRLVSRMGSSECGFIMSSHRAYDTDFGWNWLRNDNPSGLKLLRFEPVSEELFELVVLNDWPTRVVSNRMDGSFATGDLFSMHSDIPHTWRYAGRADDIIVMLNGKKASADSIETALRASSVITEAIVFGTERPVLGVLIVPSGPGILLSDILSHIHQVNSHSPSYSVILDEMVVVLESDTILLKTSKGSVVRPHALNRYATIINNTYKRIEGDGTTSQPSRALLTHGDIRYYLRQVVRVALEQCVKHSSGYSLEDHADLFDLGVNSLQAIRIRQALQQLLEPHSGTLSSNVVFENPSIDKLVKCIERTRRSGSSVTSVDEADQHNQMRDLVRKYSTFLPKIPCTGIREFAMNADASTEPGLIILTGATGALGSHILAQVIAKTELHVVVLVRAHDHKHALQRVLASVDVRKLGPLDVTRITALAADIRQENFGISSDLYVKLLEKTEIIIHAAWPVNFAYNLHSFESSLQGTYNLINTAIQSHRQAKFTFCSSVASVTADDTATITEMVPKSPSSAAPLGYGRSKWIAEHICGNAHNGPLRDRVSIARLGQLCGDTVHGIWNQSEGWPLMIASVRYTGCLPSFTEHPSWLPVDIAAQAIVKIARYEGKRATKEVAVYNILNSNLETSWNDILNYISSFGIHFSRISPDDWLSKLRSQCSSLDAGTREMLSIWDKKYGSTPDGLRPTSRTTFSTLCAAYVSPALQKGMPIREELVQKFILNWQKTGFLPQHLWG